MVLFRYRCPNMAVTHIDKDWFVEKHHSDKWGPATSSGLGRKWPVCFSVPPSGIVCSHIHILVQIITSVLSRYNLQNCHRIPSSVQTSQDTRHKNRQHMPEANIVYTSQWWLRFIRGSTKDVFHLSQLLRLFSWTSWTPLKDLKLMSSWSVHSTIHPACCAHLFQNTFHKNEINKITPPRFVQDHRHSLLPSRTFNRQCTKGAKKQETADISLCFLIKFNLWRIILNFWLRWVVLSSLCVKFSYGCCKLNVKLLWIRISGSDFIKILSTSSGLGQNTQATELAEMSGLVCLANSVDLKPYSWLLFLHYKSKIFFTCPFCLSISFWEQKARGRCKTQQQNYRKLVSCCSGCFGFLKKFIWKELQQKVGDFQPL